ncbi:MAG: helix-hairpin-helix domain-containing protein [Aquabacterium sp.]|nr:helix-hairpin-helix domain-containing protein [Aquabacterium sp.]
MIKKLLALMLALFASIAFAAVDANSGDAAQLDSVKGVGPAGAAKIIDARKAGAFKDWNDLVNRVAGIGETNAAKLSAAGLTVNGATFKGMPAAVPAPKLAKPAQIEKAGKAAEAAKAAVVTPAVAPAPAPAPAVAPAAVVDNKVADKKAEKAAKKAADKEAKAAAKEAKVAAKAEKAATKKAAAAEKASAVASSADGAKAKTKK